jgi:hypothetical protein
MEHTLDHGTDHARIGAAETQNREPTEPSKALADIATLDSPRSLACDAVLLRKPHRRPRWSGL